MSRISISVPSSVANVSCGFDVLGFCLEKPCDEMTVEIKKSQGLDIEIFNEKSIPTNPKENVCGAVAFAMIKIASFGVRSLLFSRFIFSVVIQFFDLIFD